VTGLGKFEEYEAGKVRRLGAESVDHRRVKYKRLKR
jgi:hypothetical protein